MPPATCLLRALSIALCGTPMHAAPPRLARACARRAVHAAAAKSGPLRAVRAVPIRLLSVSKGGGVHFDGACELYTSRISRYSPFEEVTVKPNPKGAAADAVEAHKSAEAERLLKQVGPRDRLVLLDERGRDVSSTQLAELVAAAGDDGCTALVFAVGGPHGHGAAMRERADVVMRLSACVLNHQVARLVLVEQIYRAWTILKGEGYHHE